MVPQKEVLCRTIGPYRFVKDEENLNELVRKSLDDNGFAIIENYLSPERTDALRKEISAILAKTPTGRTDFEGIKTRRVYAFFAKTRCFDDMAIDPFILGHVERLLEQKSILLSAPGPIEIHPGETEQGVHRDDGIYPIVVASRAKLELAANSMWALDDFTETNGSTVIYPGSHRMSEEEQAQLYKRMETGEVTRNGEKFKATMPKGSVMIYRGAMLHGGGANTSDKPRLGVILHYCAGWLRPQENHCLAIPQSITRTLPDRLKELLGYSIAPPFIGYVNGRDPKKFLMENDFELSKPKARL